MSSQDQPYPALFSPFELAGLRVRNRLVHASISTKMARAQTVTPRLLQYYRNRAAGGAGMLVSEPLSVLPWHRLPHKVNVFTAAGYAGLCRWAETVESEGCRLLGQLQDPGRGRHSPVTNPHAVGPSSLPDDLSWSVPHALEPGAVERLVERLVEAAAKLRQAGFSGVELSAGHGHLFHQFLSPWSNRRDDRYGGALENRARIVSDLVAGVRQRCGQGFIVGLKLPGVDGVEGSIDIREAARLAHHLTLGRSVDYVCFAQGSHADTLHMHLPDMTGPRCPYTWIDEALRPHCNGVPIMALGLITDPAEAEHIVASGRAEMVAMGRALIADPALPRKAAAGRARDIRYCVSCNSCWGMTAGQGKPVACDNNPRVGRPDELAEALPRARRKLRVVVAGAGPAGMEAAWVAAARGHDVTVLGRSADVGGSLRIRAMLPGGENASSVYDYQLHMASRHRVRLELGVTATAGEILALRPDRLLVATGAMMQWPAELDPAYQQDGLIPDLRAAAAALLGRRRRESGLAVVLDRDHTAGVYAMVERLAEIFDRVALVTPRESIAQAEPLVNRQVIYKRLSRLPIDLYLLSEIVPDRSLEDGSLRVRQLYSGATTTLTDVSMLSYATPRSPNDALVRSLADSVPLVHALGDAYSPGSLMRATQAGHRLAEVLGTAEEGRVATVPMDWARPA
jgi:dimethylglycine catabolism A